MPPAPFETVKASTSKTAPELFMVILGLVTLAIPMLLPSASVV